MTPWQPYAEPLRTTLTRTLGIALIAGVVIAWASRGAVSWPVGVLVALWPAFGGHWVELWFLNWLRPRLSPTRVTQVLARVVVWLVAGGVFVLAMRSTAGFMTGAQWIQAPFWLGGVAFLGVELIAHLGLQLRGRPSFYNARG
jgi:hypothetical protein